MTIIYTLDCKARNDRFLNIPSRIYFTVLPKNQINKGPSQPNNVACLCFLILKLKQKL